MVQKASNELEVNKPAYMYYLMTKSGQCSPTSDALDSGTGSDLETTPTPNGTQSSLSNAVTKSIRKFSDLSLELPNGHQHRIKSRSSNDSYNTDSEESESSLSCDSLNSSEIMRLKNSSSTTAIIRTIPFGSTATNAVCMSPTEGTVFRSDENNVTKINFLPHSLLRDIRDRSATTVKVQSHTDERSDDDSQSDEAYQNGGSNTITINDNYQRDCNSNSSASYTNEPFNLHHRGNAISEFDALFGRPKLNDGRHRLSPSTAKAIRFADLRSEKNKIFENDKYISFHLNESVSNAKRSDFDGSSAAAKDDDTFAGYKDVSATVAPSTIRSSKGTIRGVKNRVRNGIATFLQMQQTNIKVRAQANYNYIVCQYVQTFVHHMHRVRDKKINLSN